MLIMISNNQLAVLMPIVDTVVSFSVAYLTYRYLQYKNEQLVKKKNPTNQNGHNLDYSFRLEGNEVFGIHLRGATVEDLIDRALTLLLGKRD